MRPIDYIRKLEEETKLKDIETSINTVISVISKLPYSRQGDVLIIMKGMLLMQRSKLSKDIDDIDNCINLLK